MLCVGGELVVSGDVTPGATSQPCEVVTRTERQIPVHHAPLLAAGIALGASGLSSSGQKKRGVSSWRPRCSAVKQLG